MELESVKHGKKGMILFGDVVACISENSEILGSQVANSFGASLLNADNFLNNGMPTKCIYRLLSYYTLYDSSSFV